MKRLSVLLVAITVLLFLLQSGASGAEIKPIYLFPMPDSILVKAETTITFRFSEDVDTHSLRDALIHVNGRRSGAHPGTAIVTKDNRTVIFKPDDPFMPAETVAVELYPGLLSTNGSRLYFENYGFTISPKVTEESAPTASFLTEDKIGIGSEKEALPFTGASSNSYTTMPADFPELIVTVPADGAADGYIFLSNFVIGGGTPSGDQTYLLILDNEGEPVFYRKSRNELPLLDFKKQPNGLLTYVEWDGIYYGMDSSYEIVKTYQAGNGYQIDVHDLQVLPDEHALIMIYDPQPYDMSAYGGQSDATVIGLVIQELDIDGNVVFQWRSWDHYKIDESVADLTDPVVDYVHGNAVELDFDGNLLISSRAFNEITKIDRQTGDIIWRLGGKKNDFDFIDDPDLFYAQHDIRRLDSGNITIFDNHVVSGSTFARAVEYELDETKNSETATLVWEYRNNAMSRAMGNAQRLPNNNTMIGWGTLYPSLTEVKPDGQIAFEMSFVPGVNPNRIINSYRAFRFEWEGNPTTSPMLIARNDTPGITSLVVSWNGATNVSAYRAYGGETSDNLTLLTTEQRDGFETEILIADADEKLCYFQIMPLDEEGSAMRFSNLVMAEPCIESQVHFPLTVVSTSGE